MAFLKFLREMLSRQQVADLATYVAITSVDRQKAGNPRCYLNLNVARRGEVEWDGPDSASIFAMKGKLMRDVIPLVKDKIGKYTFVNRDVIWDEIGYGVPGAITTDDTARMVDLGRSDED